MTHTTPTTDSTDTLKNVGLRVGAFIMGRPEGCPQRIAAEDKLIEVAQGKLDADGAFTLWAYSVLNRAGAVRVSLKLLDA